jgi:ABC-type multidrug transport system fused ATPase/permease subunit
MSLKNTETLNKHTEFQKINEESPGQPILLIENLNLNIGGSEILKAISFSVQRGEFVAIVGEVGSGKSSLLHSLLGETGAHFGEYRVMNNSAKDMPLSQLRQFYTFVPQEGFIMSATLRENVAFEYNVGRSTDDKIVNSLKVSQFDLEVERITDGLETEIGERGVNLSGGQKQRVSLARVDYYGSPIVLLDDCLSALDVDTEDHLINDLLCGAWKDRTRILVTHRLTVLDEVDRILFLENGKIIASGTLVELLRTSPKFQTFAASVALQTGQITPPDLQSIIPTEVGSRGENEEI